MWSLRFIFMCVFTPVACAVSLRRPFYGLLALVAMYYFRPEIWGAPTWFRPQMYLTVAVGLGWLMTMREFRWSTLLTLATFIVLAFFGTSFMAAEDSGLAYDGAVVVMKLVIVMLLTVNLVDTPQKMNAFLWANVLGFVYNLKAIYIAGFSGANVDQVRVDVGVGQGGGSNYIAMICAIAFSICYVRFLHGSAREKKWALGLMFAYMVALVLTGSRAGYLSLGAVVGYFTLRGASVGGMKKALAGVATLAVVGLVFYLVVPQAHLDRFRGIGGGAQSTGVAGVGSGGPRRDFSAQSRIILWFDGALRMFGERPIAGVGLDNFPLASPRYVGFYASRSFDPYVPGVRKRGFVAHSTWFQTLAEGGLLVSIPFFALFFVAYANLRSVRTSRSTDPRMTTLKTQALQLEGTFVAFIVSSTFGSHIKIDFFWWYLGAVSALALMARRYENAPILAAQAARRRAIVRARESAVAAEALPAGSNA
jgi:hypothetical protein